MTERTRSHNMPLGSARYAEVPIRQGEKGRVYLSTSVISTIASSVSFTGQSNFGQILGRAPYLASAPDAIVAAWIGHCRRFPVTGSCRPGTTPAMPCRRAPCPARSKRGPL
jgi:hypothetical protein